MTTLSPLDKQALELVNQAEKNLRDMPAPALQPIFDAFRASIENPIARGMFDGFTLDQARTSKGFLAWYAVRMGCDV
jgi:hypothetical protein